MSCIYVVGTADTKGTEMDYLAGAIRAAGGRPLLVDIGTRAAVIPTDISAAEVSSHNPKAGDILAGTDRGTAVAAMTDAFARFIQTRQDISGIIGIGGGGGTTVITAGMQALPLGLPKIMVSTLASGDVSAFVGVSDIVMMPSITDLAGLNRISRTVLTNAANAITAMARSAPPQAEDKPAIGLTMFGVTTPCVTAISEALRADYDCLVFHATGTGGRTVEKLVDSGMLSGIIDITTTEVCDLLFGGVLPATEDRFGAIARTGLPCVISVGALDMVNFWAPETMPAHYRDRLLYRHNPNVTLMRTTEAESAVIGRWIGDKLNACSGPVHLLIPENGVSALDIEGGPFFDSRADAALFTALETTITPAPNRQITRLPLHINDPEFAEAAVAAFRALVPN